MQENWKEKSDGAEQAVARKSRMEWIDTLQQSFQASGRKQPPPKNARPSKTEKEREQYRRVVHSGPFNGLCEIESSRGSPGISNIFLPMLQSSPPPPPLLPFSSTIIPLPLSRVCFLHLLHLSSHSRATIPCLTEMHRGSFGNQLREHFESFFLCCAPLTSITGYLYFCETVASSW